MISNFMARSKLRQIIALMEDERRLLLQGPLADLPELTNRRTAILEAMEDGGPVSRDVLGHGLPQIRSLALRNKKLFEASVGGMKAAGDSLKMLENNLGAMETYTKNGEKVRVAQGQSGKDHRV